MAFSERFRESTTLKFVTGAWVLFMAKYMVSGMTIYGVVQASIDPLAFAGGTALILAPWLHREYRVAKFKT